MFSAVDEEANDCTLDIRSMFLALNVIGLYLRCCETGLVGWVEDMEDGPNLRPAMAE
jgi:hypothetical protein